MLVNRPQLMQIENDKYIVNLQLAWEGQLAQPVSPTFPGLASVAPRFGIVDTFDVLSLKRNVTVLPRLQTLVGTLDAEIYAIGPSGVGGTQRWSGDFYIQLPDTGMVTGLSFNRNGAVLVANPLTGIISSGILAFCVPVITLGTSFNCIKLADADGLMHGAVNISILTYALPPYIYAS